MTTERGNLTLDGTSSVIHNLCMRLWTVRDQRLESSRQGYPAVPVDRRDQSTGVTAQMVRASTMAWARAATRATTIAGGPISQMTAGIRVSRRTGMSLP